MPGKLESADLSDQASGVRCRWCGTIFLSKSGPGRPRLYCSHSCRQQHYVDRRTSVADGRDPEKVVLSRSSLDLYESRRLQLQLAIDDINRAKADAGSAGGAGSGPRAIRVELYEWVLEYAEALAAVELVNSSE